MTLTPGAKRLDRILKLIPFLQQNQGISLAETSQLFAISEEQLISDLNLIWLCGLPGYSHLELIDLSYDSGSITIENADTLNKPMRLSFDEATALILALETLLVLAPDSDFEVLTSLRDKLRSLIHSPSSLSKNDGRKPATPIVLPALMKALENREALYELTYYSATADRELRCEIAPIEIRSHNRFNYLVGRVIDSGDTRFFRIDRIRAISELDRPAPEEFKNGAISERNPLMVHVEVAPPGHWLIHKWELTTLEFDSTANSYLGVIPVYDITWLERAALSSGGLLSVISPPEARASVARAAARALEKYQ